jgi:hypothetical protein
VCYNRLMNNSKPPIKTPVDVAKMHYEYTAAMEQLDLWGVPRTYGDPTCRGAFGGTYTLLGRINKLREIDRIENTKGGIAPEASLEPAATPFHDYDYLKETSEAPVEPGQKLYIGGVSVTDAGCMNPYAYRGEFYIGTGRVTALRAFRDGGDTSGMQLWWMSQEGGPRRIDPDEVDWENSGLSAYLRQAGE